ncbi:Fc.00g024340.m01.CDS01 [Cosmosporella sp. VM-42]
MVTGPSKKSEVKLPPVPPPSEASNTTPHCTPISDKSAPTCRSGLYIDQLLSTARSVDSINDNRHFPIKSNGLFGGTYKLTFFSDSRLASLSTKLQNNKVDNLVQRISAVIKRRIKSPDPISGSFGQQGGKIEVFSDNTAAAAYISAYFERVHPLHPHLNRASFESTSSSAELPSLLSENKSFSALYHAVLALGCLYYGGGSFEPGKGQAWQLFSVSLALFPDLVQSHDSLLVLQAMITMSIYCLGISCLSIEHFIISEAARRAQNLASANLTAASGQAFRRAFWVIYSLEKMSSFYFGRSSVFIDSDITTPVPYIPESIFGSFDWFLNFARLSRLFSHAITALFSPGLCGKGSHYYISTIEELNADLDDWKKGIPEDIQPGSDCRQYMFRQPVSGPAILWTHYLYYSFRIILVRTHLQTIGTSETGVSSEKQAAARDAMMSVSRSILEITTSIDVEPSTPLWVLAGIPICALLVLFDEVINDPKQSEIGSSLALLDIAGGHFSRIEYASHGNLPGSLVAEFAHIAREYVKDAKLGPVDHGEPDSHHPGSSNVILGTQPQAGGIAAVVESTETGKDQSGIDMVQTSIPATTFDTNNGLYSLEQNTPYQVPWTQEDDLFLGINVMDIFGGFSTIPDPTIY